MSNVIDGKGISQEMLKEIEQEVKSYSDVGRPGLAVVQVGGREDSNIYIKKKQQACMDTGMSSTIHNLDIETNDKDVCELIERLNDDSAVNGILVQLPLPSHLNDEKILSKISYLKDVDGFHSRNMGDLAMEGRTPSFAPCTPSGCIELLRRHNIEMMGKTCSRCRKEQHRWSAYGTTFNEGNGDCYGLPRRDEGHPSASNNGGHRSIRLWASPDD